MDLEKNGTIKEKLLKIKKKKKKKKKREKRVAFK